MVELRTAPGSERANPRIEPRKLISGQNVSVNFAGPNRQAQEVRTVPIGTEAPKSVFRFSRYGRSFPMNCFQAVCLNFIRTRKRLGNSTNAEPTPRRRGALQIKKPSPFCSCGAAETADLKNAHHAEELGRHPRAGIEVRANRT